ncbi:CBS domain-containing protein [Fibrella forsythiae]|uniref:CBS domain-containing protein n=1 Tax=Fibrella forsythiae TaxID=2817061 RepID=A0ABS3JAT8_9BACT|nr:CBS domain-containing protein [Fibrella forsythiae]MBO0947103.1 CBS domain-containing protein [Fibrella forsythiae]
MLAVELIDPMIPALKPADSVAEALDWMQEHHLTQLAVVDNSQYLGVVSEDLLLNIPDDERPISEVMRLAEAVYATENQHLLELIALATEHRLDVLAILNADNEFMGSVGTTDLLRQFSRELGIQESGAILVLALDEHDYSMAEISRLIETNNVKIISSYYSSPAYGLTDQARLTLKLNRRDITAVVSTLERFGYTIDAAYASAPIDSLDQERLNALMRFLNT